MKPYQEIILDGGMGVMLSTEEVDTSPIWSGITNINSRHVVIDAHQVTITKNGSNTRDNYQIDLFIYLFICVIYLRHMINVIMFSSSVVRFPFCSFCKM